MIIFDDHGDQGKMKESDILQTQVTFPENKARRRGKGGREGGWRGKRGERGTNCLTGGLLV